VVLFVVGLIYNPGEGGWLIAQIQIQELIFANWGGGVDGATLLT